MWFQSFPRLPEFLCVASFPQGSNAQSLESYHWVIPVPASFSADAQHHTGPLHSLELQQDQGIAAAPFWALAAMTRINKIRFNLSVSLTEPVAGGNGIQCSKCLNYFFGQDTWQIESMFCDADGDCHYVDDIRHNHLPRTDDGIIVVAMDCEMVRTSRGSELAHIVVVNERGVQLASWHIRPKGRIIDLLTTHSGIRTSEEITGPNAIEFETLHWRLSEIGLTQDTYIIGHGLENDLKAMKLAHYRVIDSAVLFHFKELGTKRQSLRCLAERHLGRSIQTDCHDPYEDAIAANDLVRLYYHKMLDITCLYQLAWKHKINLDIPSSPSFRGFVPLEKRVCHVCGGTGHMKSSCPTMKLKKEKNRTRSQVRCNSV